MLLDEDPSHTAKGSLRAAEGMALSWLPKRAPELDPRDTLWGQGKDVVAADKQCTTIEDRVDRFLKHLLRLSGREALHTSGVLSDDFWLRATFIKVLRTCLGRPPPVSDEVIINLISNSATEQGLSIRAELDGGSYLTRIEVSEGN